MTQRTLQTLSQQLDEIARLAASSSTLSASSQAISGWTVAEHLDHLLKVSGSVIEIILDPKEEIPRRISLIGRAILLTGWIPRGRGRSPKSVIGTRANGEEIGQALEKIRALLGPVSSSSSFRTDVAIVRHPVFRGLTAAQGLRFLVVHNRHHLKIVREVINSARAGGGSF